MDSIIWPCKLLEIKQIGTIEPVKIRNTRMALETRRHYIGMLARTFITAPKKRTRGATLIPSQRINFLAEETVEA